MKFVKLLCTIMSLAIMLSACTLNPKQLIVFEDSDKAANDSCAQIVEAMKKQNTVALKSLFAPDVQDDIDTLEQDIDALFNFIQGDITSFSQASTLYDYTQNHGERTRIIRPSFSIETSTNIYYMSFKECIIDTQNPHNIGISSIYVVDAAVWNSEYVYGGADRQWAPGIHIDTVACPY